MGASLAHPCFPISLTPTSLLQHARRRVHSEDVIPHGIFCCTLSLRRPTSQGSYDGQALAVIFTLSLNDVTRSQLDAIPTVGFSDPILSYLSAFRFYFDVVRVLKEGYQKVNRLLLICSLPRIKPMTLVPLDETRSIQNRHFSGMGGASCRI
jgi:hypothetical protein